MDIQNKILQVESLTKAYGQGDNRTEALKGISFDVLEGEFLDIIVYAVSLFFVLFLVYFACKYQTAGDGSLGCI